MEDQTIKLIFATYSLFCTHDEESKGCDVGLHLLSKYEDTCFATVAHIATSCNVYNCLSVVLSTLGLHSRSLRIVPVNGFFLLTFAFCCVCI